MSRSHHENCRHFSTSFIDANYFENLFFSDANYENIKPIEENNEETFMQASNLKKSNEPPRQSYLIDANSKTDSTQTYSPDESSKQPNRYYSPKIMNSNHQQLIPSSSSSSSSSSSTTPASSISSSNKQELNFANSSKYFMHSLNSKQQQLIRAAKLNLTPNSTKTWFGGKPRATTPEAHTATSEHFFHEASKLDLLKKLQNRRAHTPLVLNNSVPPAPATPTSPQPRKLFLNTINYERPQLSAATSMGMAMSGSLYLEACSSHVDLPNSKAGTPSMSTSLHMDNSTSKAANTGYSELYLHDQSMYRKEAGSVCEFLSQKLEGKGAVRNNKDSSSTLYYDAERAQSPSISSLDASLSSSFNSSNPPQLPTSSSATSSAGSKHFRINSTQAKFGSVKQVDLRHTNPPLKAELYMANNGDERANNLIEV